LLRYAVVVSGNKNIEKRDVKKGNCKNYNYKKGIIFISEMIFITLYEQLCFFFKKTVVQECRFASYHFPGTMIRFYFF
jgi:hypothetical protein